MSSKRSDKEYMKALQVFSIVSSMAMMTVIDFLLAYWGGDWLDNYFQTGDHSIRVGCICLAVMATILSFYNMVSIAVKDVDEE